MSNIAQVEQLIGYKFIDKDLLQKALTRQSYANEYNCDSYEKLEFLGDAVIGCLVSRYLYDKYPELDIGHYSQIKSRVVSETSLSRIYSQLQLQPFVIFGKSEIHNSTTSTKLGSDIIEAIIGAVYLDGGIENAYAMVSKMLFNKIDKLIAEKSFIDSVTQIKNYCDKNSYKYSFEILNQSGKEHNKIFEIALIINGNQVSKANGLSLAVAKQKAAAEALINLL